MKMSLLAAVAASLLLPAGVQADQTIIVESQRNAQRAWVAQISQDLRSQLRFPRSAGVAEYSTGAVSVRFECGPDGKPVGLNVVRKSGARMLDRAAMKAVNRLGSLHPMPDGIAGNQAFRADIVFADSAAEATRLAKSLREENERRAFARKPGEPHEMALTATSALRS